ncbi:MAG TPA: hypothetical protein PLN56_04455 [Methanoregulaceae archaeon]|nr:MAG: hypothetical protein IPI71_02955 [Methanolinea sp.]HPD10233.1 hypothetical protein [Methanoregulaceae archaeon]
MLPMYVVNLYAQMNNRILRMLRDLEIYPRIIPNATPPEELAIGCLGLAPQCSVRLATPPLCENEAIAVHNRNTHGIQWQPEVNHPDNGRLVFRPFNHIIFECGSL